METAVPVRRLETPFGGWKPPLLVGDWKSPLPFGGKKAAAPDGCYDWGRFGPNKSLGLIPDLMKLTRRKVLKAVGVGLGSGGAGLSGTWLYATRVETKRLRLERVQVPIPSLPGSLDGLRIVLLSDFHLYPHTQIELIDAAVELANECRPDLALLGGDYVLSTAESIYELAPALGRLDAKYGVFAVLGNHDHWKNSDAVIDGLTRSGIHVFMNEGLTLSVGRQPLYLAGVDDGWVRRHDLEKSLANRNGEDPTLLLMHEPDFADDFLADGRVLLQLSGHSHGGQVRFPFIGSPFLPPYGRKYDQGLYRVGQGWLYTNVGIGVTAPLRLNCPPEVTEITLVSQTA